MPSVLSKLPVMMSDEDIADPRYEKCKMYLLRHKEDVNNTNVYVGHTIDYEKRWKDHIKRYSSGTDDEKNMKLYAYIRDNGGIDNWEMIIIEDYPCKNKCQASIRENYQYHSYAANLNSIEPGTMYLLGEDDYHQNYRNIHIEEKREYARLYQDTYRQEIQEKQRNYYHKNKKEIQEKRKEDILCECGIWYRKCKKLRHINTKRHQDRMNKDLVSSENTYKCQCGEVLFFNKQYNIDRHKQSKYHLDRMELLNI